MNKLMFAASAIGRLVFAAATLISCNSDKDKEPVTKSSSSSTSTSEPGKPVTREDKVDGRLKAKVRELDYATRRITLESDRGHTQSFIVSPSVRRLNEIAVGDIVEMSYSATMTAELRPPTADEAAHPIMAVNVSGRADQPYDPAYSGVRAYKIVMTVKTVSLVNMLVSLEGPMGDQVTVLAKSGENIRKLHVNDTIVVTYVEAVAASVDKVGR